MGQVSISGGWQLSTCPRKATSRWWIPEPATWSYSMASSTTTRACAVSCRGRDSSSDSQSDTEVLLKAYAHWGIEALGHLRGMFAFALWDERQRCTLLARDRLGIKPLYICTMKPSANATTVLFASELRSLLASGLVERRLNPDSIASYVWNGFVVGPETIVKGIQLLAPGSAALVQANGSCEIRRYWSQPRYKPTPDGLERMTEALETSVQQHLVSDVPLGVFLSGGIDSSAVTALAVKTAGAGVRTFNLSFDEAEYDESAIREGRRDSPGHRSYRGATHSSAIQDSPGCGAVEHRPADF